MKRASLFLVAVALTIGFTGIPDAHAKGKGLSGGYKSYKGGKPLTVIPIGTKATDIVFNNTMPLS